MFVFSDACKDKVREIYLPLGGHCQKNDMDMPQTHFPSGYMPNLKKAEDNTSGKKNSYEL